MNFSLIERGTEGKLKDDTFQMETQGLSLFANVHSLHNLNLKKVITLLL